MSHDEVKGTVELVCASGVLGALGEGFTNRFSLQFPHVVLNIREANDVQADLDLKSGDCNLELAVAPYQRDTEIEELYCCPICLWASSKDPFASKDLLTVDDLAGRDIAMPGNGFKCRDRLLRLAGEHNVDLGCVVQLNEPFQLYQFAASGKGLSFTVRHLRQNPVFASGNSVVSIPLDLASWSFGICCKTGHVLSAAEKAFWDWCVAQSAGLPCDPGCNKQLSGMCTRVP